MQIMVDNRVPMHMVDAPSQGTGKGMLLDALIKPAFRDGMRVMAVPENEAEWRKQITSYLISSTPCINVDNIKGKLDSAALAIALTSFRFSDRLLGKNEASNPLSNAMWVGTSNSRRGDVTC